MVRDLVIEVRGLNIEPWDHPWMVSDLIIEVPQLEIGASTLNHPI
jgi:hypothetical protein